MRAISVIEFAGGALLIFLGVLFFLFLPLDFQNTATDVIFFAAGALVIRKGYRERDISDLDVKRKTTAPTSSDSPRKNKQQQPQPRQRGQKSKKRKS